MSPRLLSLLSLGCVQVCLWPPGPTMAKGVAWRQRQSVLPAHWHQPAQGLQTNRLAAVCLGLGGAYAATMGYLAIWLPLPALQWGRTSFRAHPLLLI